MTKSTLVLATPWLWAGCSAPVIARQEALKAIGDDDDNRGRRNSDHHRGGGSKTSKR